ncbi:MAG: CPBP family intramembrane metalloprotease [Bacilli bacterium]|nr:CPBP family intramembrane metalloprotease [Bacilli bacterium]
MKIRCDNCYRVLDRNEEYCKSCGAHSERMKQAMETGNYGGTIVERFKITMLIFFILGFLGNGLLMIGIAMIRKDSSTDLYKSTYSLLVSAAVCAAAIVVVNKDLISFKWNGTKQQFLQCMLIGLFTLIVVSLFSYLTRFTRVIPNIFTDYLHSGSARWFTGRDSNASLIMLALVLVILTVEVVFRRLLIDVLDDSTMLSDPMVILVSGLLGAIAEFALLMSMEIIITSLIINFVMAWIYINSNRSIILNILIRLLIIIIQFMIFFV